MIEVPAFDNNLSMFGDYAERVEAILRTQANGDAPSFFYVFPTLNGPREWLLVAATQNDHRLGLEQLRAFIGPDVARIQPSPSDPSHPLNRYETVIQLAGNQGGAFLEGLELMLRVQATRPPRRFAVEIPLASLLGDFRLEARGREGRVDRGKVRLLYEQIEATGLLSLENLRFLKVEMLASCGSWRELVEVDWFDELCRTRRPITITHRLLEAVWRAHFDEFEVGEDPGNAVAVFGESDLGHRYSTLVRTVDETNSKHGRRLLMLAARTSGDRERCERILAQAPEEERRWLMRLGGLDEGPREGPESLRSSELIDKAFSEGAWGTVIDLILQLEAPEASHAQRLVDAAYELDDQAQCKYVLEAITGVDLTSALQSRAFRDRLRWVTDVANDHCASWMDWVRKASNAQWPQAFRTIEELSEAWSVDNFKNNEESSEFGTRLLEAFDGPNRPALRQSLSNLCDLASQLFNEPEAEDVVFAILTVLSTDENPSPQVREAFIKTVDGALSSGPSASRYEQLIETGEELWDRARAPGNIDWLVDLVETVVMWPCPAPDRRLGFVVNSATDIRRFASEVAVETRVVVDDLLQELGAGTIDWPQVSQDMALEIDVWARLSGKTVGLYSLVANIGARLEAKLKILCPTVQVVPNSDTVNTEKLQSLARSADYMIVDTRHASHAATGAIDAVLRRNEQILPTGGGISSFLSALKNVIVDE